MAEGERMQVSCRERSEPLSDKASCQEVAAGSSLTLALQLGRYPLYCYTCWTNTQRSCRCQQDQTPIWRTLP